MKYALMNLLADAAATTATTDAAAATETMGTGATIIYYAVQFVPMILIFVVFYFLLIRPQQKRAKAHKQMLAELKRGDHVMTSSGLIGRIMEISEEEVVIECGDAKLRMSRGAIGGLIGKSAEKAEAKAEEKK